MCQGEIQLTPCVTLGKFLSLSGPSFLSGIPGGTGQEGQAPAAWAPAVALPWGSGRGSGGCDFEHPRKDAPLSVDSVLEPRPPLTLTAVSHQTQPSLFLVPSLPHTLPG